MGDKELMNYFMEQTNKRFDMIDRQQESINRSLEKLIGFRYLILGIATALSTTVSIVIAIYFGR